MTTKSDHRSDTEMKDKDTTKDSGYEPGQTGAVKDPEHDGRLKENRETGTTLGTTEHSAKAPNVHNKSDDE